MSKVYIFIGRSGCGKGTQSKLLQDYVRAQGAQDIYSYEGGQHFREFIKGNTYTQGVSKRIYEEGGLQPEFISILQWANALNVHFTGKEVLFIDGSPRRWDEAKVFDSAFEFYDLRNITIIHPHVSREWSEKHLRGRGRADDSDEYIRKRLDWFETEVVPVIEYYRDHRDHHFVEVNGEQSIEAVHEDIKKRLASSV